MQPATRQQLNISGIDTDALLQRFNNDHQLILEILAEFAAGQRQIADDLPRLLDEDLVSAKRRAHDLKSMLGNIGAIALFEQAKRLDELLRTDEPRDAPALAAALRSNVPRLCDSIDAGLGQPESAGNAQTATDQSEIATDAQDASAELRELAMQLRRGRALEVKRILAGLQRAGLAVDQRTLVDALVPLISSFKFSDALAKLTTHGYE